MPAPICTIDASSVIALDHLDLLPQLSFLFSRVLLPKAVRDELFKRRTTKDRLHAVLDSYSFIERCDDYDKGAVDVLLIERAKQVAEDRGEAEAVVQAAKFGAIVFVDDAGADISRRFTTAISTEQSGSQAFFFELELTSSAATRNYFVKLFRRGVRLPRAAVNELLVEIGEAPLTELESF